MTDFIQVFEGDGRDHRFDHFLYGDDKLLQRTGSGYYHGEQNGNGLGQGVHHIFPHFGRLFGCSQDGHFNGNGETPYIFNAHLFSRNPGLQDA